jgi:hypothetical protein
LALSQNQTRKQPLFYESAGIGNVAAGKIVARGFWADAGFGKGAPVYAIDSVRELFAAELPVSPGGVPAFVGEA